LGRSLDLGVPSVGAFPRFGCSLSLSVPSIGHVLMGGAFWRLVGVYVCVCKRTRARAWVGGWVVRCIGVRVYV